MPIHDVVGTVMEYVDVKAHVACRAVHSRGVRG